MIKVSWVGVFRRPVIVVGRWALKVARDWQGCDCNKFEANRYRSVDAARRELLCPVIWLSPWGLLLVMAAAEPLADMMSLQAYMDVGKQWGPDCPFEPKVSDWGMYQGRRVALDYSTPAWGGDLAGVRSL